METFAILRFCLYLFQLIHSSVVDTAIVFPHRIGLPYKRALRNLMADYLKRIIQDSGERSCTDLAAVFDCAELYNAIFS